LACWWVARVRPKPAGAAEIELEIRRPRGVLLCVFAGEERGGRAVLIGGVAWARGLGFGHGASDRTASGEAVAEPVSLKTMTDRWAPPVSILNTVAAYRFGLGRLLGWPGFLTWAESVPPAFFYFLNFCFSPFLFDSDIDFKNP
jgi:hypothetical protein